MAKAKVKSPDKFTKCFQAHPVAVKSSVSGVQSTIAQAVLPRIQELVDKKYSVAEATKMAALEVVPQYLQTYKSEKVKAQLISEKHAISQNIPQMTTQEHGKVLAKHAETEKEHFLNDVGAAAEGVGVIHPDAPRTAVKSMEGIVKKLIEKEGRISDALRTTVVSDKLSGTKEERDGVIDKIVAGMAGRGYEVAPDKTGKKLDIEDLYNSGSKYKHIALKFRKKGVADPLIKEVLVVTNEMWDAKKQTGHVLYDITRVVDDAVKLGVKRFLAGTNKGLKNISDALYTSALNASSTALINATSSSVSQPIPAKSKNSSSPIVTPETAFNDARSFLKSLTAPRLAKIEMAVSTSEAGMRSFKLLMGETSFEDAFLNHSDSVAKTEVSSKEKNEADSAWWDGLKRAQREAYLGRWNVQARNNVMWDRLPADVREGITKERGETQNDRTGTSGTTSDNGGVQPQVLGGRQDRAALYDKGVNVQAYHNQFDHDAAASLSRRLKLAKPMVVVENLTTEELQIAYLFEGDSDIKPIFIEASDNFNGCYDPATKRIFMARNTNAAHLPVYMHETTHALSALKGTDYLATRDAVMALVSPAEFKAYKAEAEKARNGETLTDERVADEIFADVSATIAYGEYFWEGTGVDPIDLLDSKLRNTLDISRQFANIEGMAVLTDPFLKKNLGMANVMKADQGTVSQRRTSDYENLAGMTPEEILMLTPAYQFNDADVNIEEVLLSPKNRDQAVKAMTKSMMKSLGLELDKGTSKAVKQKNTELREQAKEQLDKYIAKMGDGYNTYIEQALKNKDAYPDMDVSSFPANSDPTYKVTVDLVGACVRMLRAMSIHKFVRANGGKDMTAMQMRALETELNKHGMALTCAYCYAFTRRANAIKKLEQMKADLISGIMPKDQKKSTAKGKEQEARTVDKELWQAALDEAEAKPEWRKAFEALPDLLQIKTPADSENAKGEFIDNLGKVSPEAARFAKNYPAIHALKQKETDAGNMKMPTGTIAIAGQILNLSNEMKSDLKLWGGLRWQSSVDFIPMMTFDYVQGVVEMAMADVAGHTYTKELDLALLMANCGFKVNLSAAPMVRNGKVVWEGEGANRRPRLDESIGSMSWADIEKAMEASPDHGGVMMLGVNDEILTWATTTGSKYAPYVIPWHSSGMPAQISDTFKNLVGAKDYTDPHEGIRVYNSRAEVPLRFRLIAVEQTVKEGKKDTKKSGKWIIDYTQLSKIDAKYSALEAVFKQQQKEGSAKIKGLTLNSLLIPTGLIIDQTTGVDDVQATKQYFAMLEDLNLDPVFEDYRSRMEAETGNHHGERFWVLKKHYARTDTPLLPPDPSKMNYDHAKKMDAEFAASPLSKHMQETEGGIIEAYASLPVPKEQHKIIKAAINKVMEGDKNKPMEAVLGDIPMLSPKSESVNTTPLFSMKPFHSKLEDAVTAKMSGKMFYPQLRAMLKKSQVSDDEIANVLGEFEGKESVTKTEVMDAIKANSVELQDVVLGGKRYDVVSLAGRRPEVIQSFDDIDEAQVFLNEESRYDEGGLEIQEVDNAPFAEKTEAGAKPDSYKEMFVTAPKLLDPRDTQDRFLKDELSQEDVNRMRHKIGDWRDGHAEYKDIKNPIVRVRFNLRDTEQGEILFIEEMQGAQPQEQKKMPSYLRDRIYDIGVKRMLAYAKEKGYVGVGFTQGQTQTDRYSLKKQIDEVSVSKNIGEDTYYIAPYKDGKAINLGGDSQSATADKVQEYLGKTLGARLVEEANEKGEASAKGLDLDVGGKGLKHTYDVRLPKLFKQYGKERIREDGLGYYIPVSEKTPESFPLFSPKSQAEEINEEETPYFSPVTDRKLLAELESGSTEKVYRAMQEIDGKLYPPMSATIGNKLREPTKLGVWEQADEMPHLINAKGEFKLEKGNKKSVPARYNPYFHTSRTPLNDQFTSAYDRPNLVTVEVEVPTSELTSGYKADKAKDAVGEVAWHSGPVSRMLPKNKKRMVILSRYAKVIRVVPDSEVAKKVAELLKGENIPIPVNVVTPSLRKELEKLGVEMSEPKGRVKEGALFSPKQNMGININDDAQDFTGQILSGKKTIETRTTPSLRSYIGERVGLVSTKKGEPAKLVGYATVGKEIEYKNKEQFNADVDKHLVEPSSPYYNEGKKFGYTLEDVVARDKAVTLGTKGIVSREIYAERRPEESDKQYAKRAIDTMSPVKTLPEDHGRYFNTDVPNTFVVPIEKIESTKSEEENAQGLANTPKRMRAAYDGVLSKRDPITVRVSRSGKYKIVDGNGTYSGAKAMGWTSLPVTIISEDRWLYNTKDVPRFTPRLALPEETKFQATQRNLQDRFNRMKVLEDHIKKQGVQLSDLANVTRGLDTMNGKVADQLLRFMEQGVNPLVVEAAKKKIKLSDIEDFLLAQHALEANAAMRTLHKDPTATAFGWTDKAARDVIAEFKRSPDYADLERIANEFRKFSEGTADLLQNNGILSKDQRDAWNAAYKFYVPVRGGEEKSGQGQGQRINAKQKRRMGHEVRDEHVIENIIKMREYAIKAVEKNNVNLSIAKFIHEAGDDSIGTVGKPTKKQQVRDQAVYEVYRDGTFIGSFVTKEKAELFRRGDEIATKTPPSKYAISQSRDQMVIWAASPMLGDNEINAYIGGNQIRIQINDEILARVLTNMDAEGLNTVLKVGKSINNKLSKAYTGYDPRFTIRNTLRDFTSGVINLTGDYGAVTAAKIVANYPKALKEFWKGRHDPQLSQWVDKYRKNGGSTGASWLSSLERLGGDIESMYHEQISAVATYDMVYEQAIADGKSKAYARVKAATKSGIAKFKKIPLLGHFLKSIETMNAISENAFRLATFITLVEQGKSEAEAGQAAKNSTINFDKRGEMGAQIGAAYLFFNPAAQGIQRSTYAMFRSKHRVQVNALIASFGALGWLAAELAKGWGDDDDKWEKIGRSTKNRNLILRVGENKFITLPIPYEYGAAVGIGYAMSDLAHGKFNKKTGLNLAAVILDGYMPFGNPVSEEEGISVKSIAEMLPTVAKMMIAPITNLNSFGQPIAPEKYGRDIPNAQNMYRGTKGTAYESIAKFMAESTGGNKYEKGLVDVSPELIKFYARSVLGGGFTFAEQVFHASLKGVAGVMPELNQMPMVSVLLKETDVKDDRRGFWEIAKEAESELKAFKGHMKDNEFEKADKIAADHANLLAVASLAESQQKLIKAKRDEIDAIRTNEDLSLKEKNEQMKDIEAEESNLYNELIQAFKAQ